MFKIVFRQNSMVPSDIFVILIVCKEKTGIEECPETQLDSRAFILPQEIIGQTSCFVSWIIL